MNDPAAFEPAQNSPESMRFLFLTPALVGAIVVILLLVNSEGLLAFIGLLLDVAFWIWVLRDCPNKWV